MKNARGGEIDDVDLIRDDETLYVFTEIVTKDRVVTENVAIFDKPDVAKPLKPPTTYRKSHTFGNPQAISRGYSVNILPTDGNRNSLEYVFHLIVFEYSLLCFQCSSRPVTEDIDVSISFTSSWRV